MSFEDTHSHEIKPEVVFGSVIEIAYQTDRRAVVLQRLGETGYGTSEIIDETTAEERLAFAGSTPHQAIRAVTGEVWDEARIRQGLAATYGIDAQDGLITAVIEQSGF